MRKGKFLWLLVVVLLCSATLPATASDFSKFVLFGDSLSDDGNLFAATGGTIPSPRLYYRGRSSNGRVWPEFAAETLGLPLLNYAYAGARSDNGNVVGDFPGLVQEIDKHLQENNGQLDANALHVLWAAANDFMHAPKGTDLSALAPVLVENMISAALRLERAGARFIVLLTMPDLGITPWALDGMSGSEAANMTKLSRRFNDRLVVRLAEELPGAIAIDALAIHQQIAANPSAYGYVDVFSSCLSSGCADPRRYLFWDERHPTTRTHGILADYVVSELSRFGARADSIGVLQIGTGKFLLADSVSSNKTYRAFVKRGSVGTKPVAGDWNGDGIDTFGYYDPLEGKFYLSDSNRKQGRFTVKRFGARKNWAAWPIAGDWDGDGRDTVGIHNPVKGTVNLDVSTASKPKANKLFRLGPRRENRIAVAGDWDGDGVHTVGLYAPEIGRFVLRNENIGSGPSGIVAHFKFGGVNPENKPLAGDWNGDGYHSVGVYQPSSGEVRLKNANRAGLADYLLRYGEAGVAALPNAGNWNDSN